MQTSPTQSPSQPVTPTRASGGNKSRPLLITLAVLAIAAYAVYRYWIGTPQYSLLQARRAASAHDLSQFEKYVDIESCIAGLIDDVTDEGMKEAAKAANVPDNPWSKAGEKFGGQMAQSLLATIKPTLVVLFRQQVRDYIEKGSLDNMTEDGFKIGLSPKDLETKAREQGIKFNGFDYVKRDGVFALVGLDFTSTKGPAQAFTVELKMRRTDNGWQVSRWNNAAQLISKLAPIPKPAIDPLPTVAPPQAEATPATPASPTPEATASVDPTPTMPAPVPAQ